MSSNTTSMRRAFAAIALTSGMLAMGAAASAQTVAPAAATPTNTVALSTRSTSSNQPTDAWSKSQTWSQLQALLGGGL
jgi:hypothetical protein